MKAILLKAFGDTDVMELGYHEKPVPGPEELLVKVYATSINRADILQRRGKYSPPPGASEVLGLEVAGEVESCGKDVTLFKPGDRVFGLVPGGGYAEHCVLDQYMAFPVPKNFTYHQASAIAEAFIAASETLFEIGRLCAGESVMIHAGSSGVGTAGIQMAHAAGAKVFITSGSDEKIIKAIALGANAGINYKVQDFVKEVLDDTQGLGVDLVQDFIGADYFHKNLEILRRGGRLVQVGVMHGSKVELNLKTLMTQCHQIHGFVLRTRSLNEKRAIAERFAKRWMTSLETGGIQPVIDSVFPMSMVKEAHRYVESNQHFGKVVLGWDTV